MPSKIQQVASMLDGLDKYELECIISLAGQAVKSRPAAGCKLLELPAELRNLIYYEVAKNHMRGFDFDGHNSLLRANKQLRAEYMDMLQSKHLVAKMEIAVVQFSIKGYKTASISWELHQNPKLQGAVLAGGKCPSMGEICALEDARTDVEQDIAYFGHPNTRRITSPTGLSRIYGILELTSGKQFRFAPFSISTDLLKKFGLEHELVDMEHAVVESVD